MSRQKTSAKGFKAFCDEAGLWIQELGLLGYQVHFAHEDSDGMVAKAWCQADSQNRVAALSLADRWENDFEKPTEENIRITAFHEVCELLLWELRELACSNRCDEEAADKAVHGVIRRMENVFYRQLGGKPKGKR